MIEYLSDITVFKGGSLFQQIKLLDNFYDCVDIERESGTALFKFLAAIVEGADNDYLKRTAFKIIAELTLAGKITNTFSLLGIMQELLTGQNDGLKTISLKYLQFFPANLAGSMEQLVKSLSDSPDGEIASQAYFCLGIIHLINGLNMPDVTELIPHLQACSNYFKAAAQSIENRVDADFFQSLIEFTVALLADDPAFAGAAFLTLEQNLFMRQLYSSPEDNIALDFLVYRHMQLLKDTFTIAANSGSWIEIKPNIETLFQLKSERAKLGLADPQNQALISLLNKNALAILEENIFAVHLQAEKRRLTALRHPADQEPLASFIEYLLGVFPNEEHERRENYPLLAMLSGQFDSEVALKVYDQIQNKEVSVEKAIGALLKLEHENQQSFSTGSIQGSEVLGELMAQLDIVLPGYPPGKRMAFMNILEEVIRYARVSFVNNDKKRFSFLFSESEGGKGQKAIEQDLQDSMIVFFEHAKIADGLDHERARFVDGGRVDIVYKKDLITIPMELKKSDKRPDTITLEKNYIAQAQTYTAGYDQIGLFILLELSDKTKEPPPNFKDWFKIHHLPPATNQDIKYPDYVVSVIIPGNRTSPSANSTYK